MNDSTEAYLPPQPLPPQQPEQDSRPQRSWRRAPAVAAGLIAGGVAGVAIAMSVGANAATPAASTAATSYSSTTSNTAPTGTPPNGTYPGRGGGGPHVANGITETPLTGDTLAKATAAAKAAEPGATVIRAETDADGAKYEVHMTKSDGSVVTVKLDANFAVTGTVNGMG